MLFSTDFVERPRDALIILRRWNTAKKSHKQKWSQSDYSFSVDLVAVLNAWPCTSASDFSISNLSWHQLVAKS